MPVLVSLLRGVNLAAHKRVKMDALRALYASLKLRNPQTFLQSGNVIFATDEKDLRRLVQRIENAVLETFGFHSDVILRTPAELRAVVAANPFVKRRNLDPSKFLVTFLASLPDPACCDKLRQLTIAPEELHIQGRELYVYCANGLARPKLSWPAVERILKTSGTARNWNTVTNVLALAEKAEHEHKNCDHPSATKKQSSTFN
ncbi:MAG TPA: DUF1697 domain-containing protein [Terriglobales bacterium]|nr:DUF1697 domain-containing protein [Terriglobales bacterium]